MQILASPAISHSSEIRLLNQRHVQADIYLPCFHFMKYYVDISMHAFVALVIRTALTLDHSNIIYPETLNNILLYYLYLIYISFIS